MTGGELRELPPGAAHLWYLQADEVHDAELLASWRSLLTEDEQARVDRFVFPSGKRECLAARALVRTVLSRYAPVPPACWRFESDGYGRPRIAAPLIPSVADLHFNLSHSGGLVICLVSREPEMGVDVEDTRRSLEFLPLADRFFAPSEARSLWALPPERRTQRFFALWTLKEAYLKARGLGLSLPLADVAFELTEDGSAKVSFSSSEGGTDADHWQFRRLALGQHHLVSVAIRSGERAPFSIEVRPTVPLRDP